MSVKTPDLGQDVDAYCTKCKLVLAHTVVKKDGNRILRGTCNTCKAEHAYRATAKSSPARKRSSTAGTKKPRTKAVASQFDDLLGGRPLEEAIEYTIQDSLVLSQLIAHTKFGVGVVSALKSGNKAEVVFPDAVRVLIHSRT